MASATSESKWTYQSPKPSSLAACGAFAVTALVSANRPEREQKEQERRDFSEQRNGPPTPRRDNRSGLSETQHSPRTTGAILKLPTFAGSIVETTGTNESRQHRNLFYGDSGHGKSFLACAIGERPSEKLVSVSVTNFPRI